MAPDELSEVPQDADERWMGEALELASLAGEAGEVPVGAVVVRNGTVIGRGRNRMRETEDPRAHAEMEAIASAQESVGTGRLDGDSIFVTLEPCPQCAGAILLVRLSRIVFGAWDSRLGACGSQFDCPGAGILSDVRVRPEVREEECSTLLSEWFRAHRGDE